MVHTKRARIVSALSSILMVAATSLAFAFDPPRAVLSDKLVGLSVRDVCPSEAVIADIREEGAALNADYTQIVEVAGASQCPDALSSYHTIDSYPSGAVLHFVGGVTVGLHYRLAQ